MTEPFTCAVGVHFHRHRGGPGRITVEPGAVTLAGRRKLVHSAGPITVEHKRWEPPWGNRWIALTDGTDVAHAVVSRTRCERIVEALRTAGFEVAP